jgi:hypothetical protein
VLLLAVTAIVVLFITKKYHFVMFPKGNTNDEWGQGNS